MALEMGLPAPLWARLTALILRPITVFLGVSWIGHRLFVLSDQRLFTDLGTPGRSGVAEPSGYIAWLGSFPPLEERAIDALGTTALTLVAGLLIALPLAGLFTLLARSGAAGGFGALAIPLLGFGGPGLAVFLFYWLVIRFDVGRFGSFSLIDEPVDALRALLVPGLLLGLTIAPGLATIGALPTPFREPIGLTAAGSSLASRSEPRDGWRVGFPAGLVVAALMASELLSASPGMFRLLFFGLVDPVTREGSLDALGLLAIVAALGALAIDLVGLRPDHPTAPTAAGLRLTGSSSRAPIGALAGFGGLLLVLIVAGIVGTVTLDGDVADVAASRSGPFTDGHLLGTDLLGRDTLARVLQGIVPTVGQAVIVGFLATVGGLLLRGLHRAFGDSGVGELVPGVLTDLLWFPAPLMIAMLSFALTDPTVFHPAIVLATALVLSPVAFRILRRERVGASLGGVVRVLGVWFLVAAGALMAQLAATLIGGPVANESPTLGTQIGLNTNLLVDLTWPVASPAVAAGLIGTSLYGLGAALVRLGWHHSAAAALDDIDREPEPLVVPDPTSPYPVAQPSFAAGGVLAPDYTDTVDDIPRAQDW